ncbi:MAG: deoxyribodipyrimidine photo-lyase, partial [Bacteriovoracaceae bacterium]|nr:deoxyribodipyrimidine photo-lyase [Bacteriovoracaceae bacterium]
MKKALCWLRRDLRLQDHAALSAATEQADQVELVFVFDKKILKDLPKNDLRLSFIYQSLTEIEKLAPIHILHGDPVEEIPKLFSHLKAEALFFNRDYEPYAKERDQKVKEQIGHDRVFDFKDHVIFESHEVLKDDRTPYKVFTPYKKRWLEKFQEQGQNISEFKVNLKKISRTKTEKTLTDFNWALTELPILTGGRGQALQQLKRFEKAIADYDKQRDFPALEGTSNISTYIRHGNISVRELLRASYAGKSKGHEIWRSELIWREFYQMILDRFPHVARGAFKPEYDKIKWLGSDSDFQAWCEGRTGFPIVDAAMRCLNQTGLMHNRLRMIVASFLCKTLLIDWRRGEKYFAEKLLDFDLAANNGGWQWSSSSGCDAQPYFRIFNPELQ